jgi:CRP-like cAMP-binding protein
MEPGPFKNTILRHLDADIIERLRLRPLQLEVKHALQVPGEPIKQLYFVEAGIGSMTTVFRNGFQVEVGMFGYESVVGVSGLMGTKRSLNSTFMQLAGHGFASPVRAARAEFERHEKFHSLALRYVQAQLTQATQSAACNAHHHHNQRLARWLLICADRSEQQNFKMSHQYLAEMLGSTRQTVSSAASDLKHKGLIDYRRGTVFILDHKGLETEACECYQVVKSHLENVTEFDTGFAV